MTGTIQCGPPIFTGSGPLAVNIKHFHYKSSPFNDDSSGSKAEILANVPVETL